jgi:cleavage stimulation factor subunit 3
VFFRFSDVAGSHAENQKIAAVRKVYQKAIMMPMISVELLWKDYCTYEMVNRHIEQ